MDARRSQRFSMGTTLMAKTIGEAWSESMASDIEQKEKKRKANLNIQKTKNEGYEQSPFPMVSGTSKHASALKQGFDIKKKTKDYTSPKAASYKREKQITKEHNIEAEKGNPTGNTCMVCGESRSKHVSNYPHAFEAYKGPELTKPE